MATGLKSVLRTPRSALILKTLIFAGFLLLLKIGSFGLVPILFFLAAAFSLFFRPFFQTIPYFISFLIFIILGMFFVARLPGNYFFVGFLFLSFLFYLLSGVKTLVLVNRSRAYLIFNLALFYLTFILFFASGKESSFIGKLLGVFLAAVLLFRDLFKFQDPPAWPKPLRRGEGPLLSVGWNRRSTVGWVLALLVVETIWAINLLPIGFLQSANLALLSVFILQDLSLKYFQGVLNRRAILRDVTIFVLLTLLIFMTSRWSI